MVQIYWTHVRPIHPPRAPLDRTMSALENSVYEGKNYNKNCYASAGNLQEIADSVKLQLQLFQLQSPHWRSRPRSWTSVTRQTATTLFTSAETKHLYKELVWRKSGCMYVCMYVCLKIYIRCALNKVTDAPQSQTNKNVFNARLIRSVDSRGRPNVGFGYGFGAECGEFFTFGQYSVSAKCGFATSAWLSDSAILWSTFGSCRMSLQMRHNSTIRQSRQA